MTPEETTVVPTHRQDCHAWCKGQAHSAPAPTTTSCPDLMKAITMDWGDPHQWWPGALADQLPQWLPHTAIVMLPKSAKEKETI